MVISGEWGIDDDGIGRPLLRVYFELPDGGQDFEAFVVDTGADCTLFTDRLIAKFGMATQPGGQLVGVGGQSAMTTLAATMILKTVDGRDILIGGTFAGSPDAELDLNLLGRDVLANFDVIVSRRRNEVLLVAGNHRYVVTE